MFQEITIENFKSIVHDTISLGRVNVFIGENGCGKSNILEAMAFLSAAFEGRVNNENLLSKGVRLAKPALMMSSFKDKKTPREIIIAYQLKNRLKPVLRHVEFLPLPGQRVLVILVISDFEVQNCMVNTTRLYSAKELEQVANYFNAKFAGQEIDTISQDLFKEVSDTQTTINATWRQAAIEIAKRCLTERFVFTSKSKEEPSAGWEYEGSEFLKFGYENFVIYSPNTLALRGFTNESHKEPLGIYGENLDVLIASFDKEEQAELQNYNYLIDWLSDFMVDTNDQIKLRGFKPNRSQSTLYFSDKYMMTKNNIFSSENANEGVLHLLFYLAVMISKKTPQFFAIDNIESCFNPHLCTHIMKEICELAKKHDKQLLITTHNPAILDGLNLHDDEIRLFEVKRLDNGQTKTRRIKLKPPHEEQEERRLKLSELWTRGYLGAISKNF